MRELGRVTVRARVNLAVRQVGGALKRVIGRARDRDRV